MKPPFAYYGGKMGMAERIVALLPQHRTYIEPFFGSGAVFFAKRPGPCEIINDLDDGVVTFFRVLRERAEDLEAVCRLTPHARAEYEAAVMTPDLDDLERARRFWVRVNQSFAKRPPAVRPGGQLPRPATNRSPARSGAASTDSRHVPAGCSGPASNIVTQLG